MFYFTTYTLQLQHPDNNRCSTSLHILSNYNIQKELTLHLVLCLCGGMQAYPFPTLMHIFLACLPSTYNPSAPIVGSPTIPAQISTDETILLEVTPPTMSKPVGGNFTSH